MAPEIKLQLLQEEKHACGCGKGSCDGSHAHGEHGHGHSSGHGMETELLTAQKAEQPPELKTKQLKVVLCTTPQVIFKDRSLGEYPTNPKMAIVTIYKWMKDAGFNPSFYDIDNLVPTDNEIFQYFQAKQPDVVGISAVVSASYAQVKRISRIIRTACPKAFIILGGYMAASAHVLLRKTDVNLCILGDGETPFTTLCDYINKNPDKLDFAELKKIRGLSFISENNELEITGYGESKLNNIHYFPDFDIFAEGCLGDYELMKSIYFRKAKGCAEFNRDPRTDEPHRKPNLVSVFTTKGCVARCTFCQRFSRGYNVGHLGGLEEFLKYVKEKYDVGAIFICDENFGSDRKHAYEVAELMKKYDLLWHAAGVRVSSITYDDIKYFKERGMVGIKFGVESGSQSVLNVMEKRITVKQLLDAFKAAKEVGVYSSLGFCIGMPGETNETISETGKFIGEIARMRGIPPSNIFMDFPYATPFPGTPLYQYALLNGFVEDTIDGEEKYLTWVEEKTAKKIEYVNMSGSSMKDALFWDFLAKYEAMRYYYENQLKDVKITSPTIRGKNIERETTVKAALKTMSWANFVRYLTYPATTLNEILINTRVVTKIPRGIFYPLMRNLLYVEFIMQKAAGIRKHYSFKQAPAYPIGTPLREVAAKLIKERWEEPKTLSEKNRRILLEGR